MPVEEGDLVRSTQASTAAGVGTWTTRVESVLNWSRSYSLSPLVLSAGCCAASGIEAGMGPRHDLDEFGGGVLHYAPEHADLLIVGGPLSPRRVPEIERVYARMAEPKWVVAYGACACSGGAYDAQESVSGLGNLLPVDIYIPGCPPRSEALLDGLSQLRARIRGEAQRTA